MFNTKAIGATIAVTAASLGFSPQARASFFQNAEPPTPMTTADAPKTPDAKPAAKEELFELQKITINGKELEISNRALKLNEAADAGKFEAHMTNNVRTDKGAALAKEAFEKAGRISVLSLGDGIGIPSFFVNDRVLVQQMKDAGVQAARIEVSNASKPGEKNFALVLDFKDAKEATVFSIPGMTLNQGREFQKVAPELVRTLLGKHGIHVDDAPNFGPVENEGVRSKSNEKKVDTKAAEPARVVTLEDLQKVVADRYETRYAGPLNNTPPRAYSRGAFTSAGEARTKLDKQLEEVTGNIAGLKAVREGSQSDESVLKTAQRHKEVNVEVMSAAVRLGLSPEEAIKMKPEQMQGLIDKANELQARTREREKQNRIEEGAIRREISKLR